MITNLTGDGVSILTIVDGQNHRRAYSNSAHGRVELAAEQPKKTVTEVFKIWGDTPTIEDIVNTPDIPDPGTQPPTIEARVADLEDTVATMLYGGESL